jgi:hypothetical protein
MPSDIYVAEIVCCARVIEKINSKHGVTEQDVRDAVQWPATPLAADWIEEPDDPRGPRAVVVGDTGTDGSSRWSVPR